MMKKKLLNIINCIRENKGESIFHEIKESDELREIFGFTSFDLAELTVRIEDEFDVDVFEDGIVNSIGEIIAKIK
jgi:acyl carrier protein